jgi:predicted lactoylglutathione lyase
MAGGERCCDRAGAPDCTGPQGQCPDSEGHEQAGGEADADSDRKGRLMTTKIFVNLPVKNLERSKGFFETLGFRFNPQFTDDTAACMVISDDIYAMLLTHAKFKEFTKKKIVDATKATEVLTCLALDSKASVDKLVQAALGAGGTEAREAMDYGFMYGRSFNDPDGHIWEVIWMDPRHVQQS